jgi:carboxyl-terminal processing protease
MLSHEIGYIRPETLQPGKSAEIAAAARSLEKQGAKGLILDLRNCALGTADEGIAVASLFLNGGPVTYLLGQQIPRKDFRADPAKLVSRLPLVVTTNRGTAVGAEIAAAALLHNKRAEVVGERTFGDAAVRRTIGLEDGGAIILSVAKYYSPDEKAIQDTGVVPSVAYIESEPASDLEEEDQAAPRPVVPQAPVSPEDDNLLKKAIEVLTRGPRADASSKPPSEPIRRDVSRPSDILTPLGVPQK